MAHHRELQGRGRAGAVLGKVVAQQNMVKQSRGETGRITTKHVEIVTKRWQGTGKVRQNK